MARKPLVISDERAKFKDFTFDDIAEYCFNAGMGDWLEETLAKPFPHYKWQKTTVVDEATGKKKRVVDKSKPKKLELGKPTFIQLKEAFLQEVVGIEPVAKKEATKTLSMAEKLAALKAERAAKSEPYAAIKGMLAKADAEE